MSDFISMLRELPWWLKVLMLGFSVAAALTIMHDHERAEHCTKLGGIRVKSANHVVCIKAQVLD